MISTIAEAVLEEVFAWQQRPLDPVYPLVFFDPSRFKIRSEGLVSNEAIHFALGILAGGTPPRSCRACGSSKTKAPNSDFGS